MINIFLDDERKTPPGFVRVYTVQDCCDLLKGMAGKVDILSLDNDLGVDGLKNEGREVPLWLAEQAHLGNNYWPKRIRIHSANPVAREYIRAVVMRHGCYRWNYSTQEFVNDLNWYKLRGD